MTQGQGQERYRWVSSDHFNRILALYQVLPGPEAHEMCVHFGVLARGRVGGVLAGIALIARAVHRIGSHVLLNPWLWAIGVGAFVGQLLGVHFALLLAAGGLIYFARRLSSAFAVVLLALCFAGLAGTLLAYGLLSSSPLRRRWVFSIRNRWRL